MARRPKPMRKRASDSPDIRPNKRFFNISDLWIEIVEEAKEWKQKNEGCCLLICHSFLFLFSSRSNLVDQEMMIRLNGSEEERDKPTLQRTIIPHVISSSFHPIPSINTKHPSIPSHLEGEEEEEG